MSLIESNLDFIEQALDAFGAQQENSTKRVVSIDGHFKNKVPSMAAARKLLIRKVNQNFKDKAYYSHVIHSSNIFANLTGFYIIDLPEGLVFI